MEKQTGEKYIHLEGFRLAQIPFPDPKIVGGKPVDIREHPHQLSLQTYGHICGASIISSKWAITAGHCVGFIANNYKLSAGSNSRNDGDFYRVKRIVRHPNYDYSTIDFDIALLQIEGEIILNNSTVAPVKLAEKELPEGAIVNVTGWGATQQGGPTSLKLMQVSVPIVHRDVCQSAYEGLNEITPRMICAGDLSEGGKDSCQGDSGGPLTANGTLYGIVSWGYGCARPRYPGVYSNVAMLRSWVKEISGV
ncbi:trypsin 5G1-like [Prorops nasuta]|uniref:trypsin 5G1-like n=1 Tax=Prorops nasuta TaxID=863751 RepID=UPI0034D00705